MIKVYFESPTKAELVASFEDEEVFMGCLHVLERIALDNRMQVTTSEV